MKGIYERTYPTAAGPVTYFQARISEGGIVRNLGSFNSEAEALLTWNAANNAKIERALERGEGLPKSGPPSMRGRRLTVAERLALVSEYGHWRGPASGRYVKTEAPKRKSRTLIQDQAKDIDPTWSPAYTKWVRENPVL